ncbi:MAG: tetratricopeptide repeat protein [Deltaproteobacteria bacterium]|nr:tetratricopeptide repeat protein [Deltaproteobacteria bacterium]MBN2672440.1 tetratricopeptide repeat protein [Deltaproteobacteria bacterium]
MKNWKTVFGVLVSVGLYAATAFSGESAEPNVTVVSASGSVKLRTAELTTPEQWPLAAAMLKEQPQLDAVLVRYPNARYTGIVASQDAPLDVLFIDSDGQVRGILETLDDNFFHGFEKPVIAMLCLRAGAVARHKMARGNLVLLGTGAFAATAPGSAKETLANLKDAESRLRKAAARNSRSALELGALYLEQRDFEKAKRVFSEQVAKKGDASSRIGLAMALSGMGEVERSIQMLIDVVQSDDSNEEAYLNLARIFRYVRKVDAIVAVLAAGVSAHPELLSLRLELAKLYLENGKLNVAAQILDAGIFNAGAVDKAKLARVRGDVYLREGALSDAAASYAAYLDVFPSAPHAAELRLFIARHRKGDE